MTTLMNRILLNFLLVIALPVLMPGCGNETPATPNEKTEKLLRASTWILSDLKVDNVSTQRYAGMTLSFGTGVYTTTGGEPVWPAAGTWAFEGQGGNKILRNDGLLIDVIAASAAQITLAFDWTETTYVLGRQASLPGRHVMVFVRK